MQEMGTKTARDAINGGNGTSVESDAVVCQDQNPGGFTAEVYASSSSLLDTTRSGARKGLQQYFTPPDVARFIQTVVNPKGILRVLDPTAGDGSLLWPHRKRFGVEIHEPTVRGSYGVPIAPGDSRYKAIAARITGNDRDGEGGPVSADQSYVALRGDIQHVYPLLRISGLRFSALVANPPFGLTWQVRSLNGGKPASSTLLTWLMCQNLRRLGAQGAFICGTGRLDREILSDPDALKAIYCVIDMRTMFAGVDLPCSIAFWADPDRRARDETICRIAANAPSELPAHLQSVTDARKSAFARLAECDGSDLERIVTTAETFPLIQEEYDRRTGIRVKRTAYDVQLRGDRIEVYLSPLAISAMDSQHALLSLRPFLASLHRQRSSYFALNTRDWRRLQQAIDSDLITMDSSDRAKVDALVERSKAVACPVYPIEPQQRLAYIQDLENLRCTVDDPERGYVAGESYPVDVSTAIDSRERTETKADADGIRTLTFRADYKVLKIMVGGDRPRRYCETKEDIEYLLAHFDIPDPGDVSTRYPEEIERWRTVIRKVQAQHMPPGVTPKAFQVEDVARLLFKGSGVLSWEQGGGKTFGSMLAVTAFEEAGQSDGNALFVVPQDLIPQWREEAMKFFGRDLEHIATRAQALDVRRAIQKGEIESHWYITHYEALAINDLRADHVSALQSITGGEFVRVRRPARSVRGRIAMAEEPVIRRVASLQTEDGERRCFQTIATSKDLCPRCMENEASGNWDGYHCKRCGETRALLVLKPMAHEVATAFKKGCIVVDEGTKIKADESLTSLAVRGLRARHRMLLTGTPQKNYVHDLFHLLCWALGPASVRFPFAWGSEGKRKFEADFCVVERLVGGNRRKVLPEVTNLSVLWRLLSGAIIRRRKENMGERIVDRTFVPLTVPFGTRQREQYAKWLGGFTQWYADKHPELEHDAIESQAAILGQLVKLEYATTLPCADPDCDYWHVGVSNWTPKALKVLEIASRHAVGGEKVLIGSDLMQTGRFLARQLTEKGVSAAHILDETGQTLGPRERAARVKEFTTGGISVLCASVQSIALGHNLDCASVVILSGLPWDFATLDQFLARVHRLTSLKPVTVYVVLTQGSLDERKWKLLQDKTASAELAIDGHLVEKKQKPVSQQEILEEMKRKGMPIGETVSEQDIYESWKRLSFSGRRNPAERAVEEGPATVTIAGLPTASPVSRPAKQLCLFDGVEGSFA